MRSPAADRRWTDRAKVLQVLLVGVAQVLQVELLLGVGSALLLLAERVRRKPLVHRQLTGVQWDALSGDTGLRGQKRSVRLPRTP